MKKILKVVITGGPCAGKTTALDSIKRMLEKKGYEVLICDETATQLINANAIPNKNTSIKEFQKQILNLQVAKEDSLLSIAESMTNDKVAILYDRGILDNRAYITHEEFDELRKNKGLTIPGILNRYDLIIHLVSLAKDKPEEYIKQKGTNPARLESLEEAIHVEDNTMKAWPEVDNKYVIDNDCDFLEKIERIKEVIEKHIEKKELKAKASKIKRNKKKQFIVKRHGKKYLVDTYLDGSDMNIINLCKKDKMPINIADYRRNKVNIIDRLNNDRPKVFSKAI